jgi:superfamily I DNA/RNA helicase
LEHQVLSEKEAMIAALAEVNQTAHPARWTLSENCRNYRIVGETAAMLSGLGDSIYTGYLRTGGGIHNYNIAFYDTEQAQLEQLAQLLREFKAQGYKASEITILSFRADEFSSATRLRQNGHKLRPARQPGDATAFTTVHAFKGMENKIIVLTDVELNDTDFHRDLFYTGMTRATESVRVLCRDGSQATLAEWITKGKVKV